MPVAQHAEERSRQPVPPAGRALHCLLRALGSQARREQSPTARRALCHEWSGCKTGICLQTIFGVAHRSSSYLRASNGPALHLELDLADQRAR
eukprot:1178636-Prorocentrum_minimum.AAC.1